MAHIKSTFNNTIISITDLEGNVLSWASAGNVGFKGSRKSTPFAAQMAAEACISPRRRSTVCGRVDVEVKGPGSGLARQRSARCRPPASRSSGSRTSRRYRTTAAGLASGGGSKAWLDTPDPSANYADVRRRSCSSRARAAQSPKCPIEKGRPPPGEHGRGRVRESEYLLQFREKQKAKRFYGILEKQFRSYYEEAARSKGVTGEELMRTLRAPVSTTSCLGPGSR